MYYVTAFVKRDCISCGKKLYVYKVADERSLGYTYIVHDSYKVMRFSCVCDACNGPTTIPFNSNISWSLKPNIFFLRKYTLNDLVTLIRKTQ